MAWDRDYFQVKYPVPAQIENCDSGRAQVVGVVAHHRPELVSLQGPVEVSLYRNTGRSQHCKGASERGNKSLQSLLHSSLRSDWGERDFRPNPSDQIGTGSYLSLFS